MDEKANSDCICVWERERENEMVTTQKYIGSRRMHAHQIGVSVSKKQQSNSPLNNWCIFNEERQNDTYYQCLTKYNTHTHSGIHSEQDARRTSNLCMQKRRKYVSKLFLIIFTQDNQNISILQESPLARLLDIVYVLRIM